MKKSKWLSKLRKILQEKNNPMKGEWLEHKDEFLKRKKLKEQTKKDWE